MYIQLRDLAARCARGFAFRLPSSNRERGEDRVRAAPAISQACCKKIGCPRAYRFSGEHTGLPHAMALRLIRVRPGDRLSCHHRLREALASLSLDVSTGT